MYSSINQNINLIMYNNILLFVGSMAVGDLYFTTLFYLGLVFVPFYAGYFLGLTRAKRPNSKLWKIFGNNNRTN